jgi:succinate dehydrogenase / fumarate reductase membrane anchor subunit
MSLETPLHRVQGFGSAHSGTQHFWRQRITAVALIPLSIWFGVSALRLVGARETDVLNFFHHPWNAGLMGMFVVMMLIHMMIGLQSVIDDYVYTPGWKLVCLLINRAFALVMGVACLLALLQIAL